uniref:Uncharacterized protein n=1 Tax=Arundo donax TaxID=35708 RepID=A0A0A8ZCV3_ARUDO
MANTPVHGSGSGIPNPLSYDLLAHSIEHHACTRERRGRSHARVQGVVTVGTGSAAHEQAWCWGSGTLPAEAAAWRCNGSR